MSLPAVSYLFVPGSRDDRFQKAVAAGPDRVILDLEDAVDASDKDDARHRVCDAIRVGLGAGVLVRLNAADSMWLDEDLAQLAGAAVANPGSLAGVVLPKLESGAVVDRIRAEIPLSAEAEIVGLIESAVGAQAVDQLARCGVTRLGVGAVDLSVDIGADVQSMVLDQVYARAVIASRAAGLDAPIGSPPLEIHSSAAIEADARRLRSLGVGGQLCIHPAQLMPVHLGFTPTSEQLEWARRILDSSGAVVQVDGLMVDKPVRDRAAHILRSSRTEAGS